MVDRSPMSLSDIKAKLQALGDSASMALYRAAKNIDRHDGDSSETINGKEWSIFETAAKGMVRNKSVTVQEYESIFGAGSYKEEEPPKPKAPAAPVDTTKTKKPEAESDTLGQDTTKVSQAIIDATKRADVPKPMDDDAYNAGRYLFKLIDGETDDSKYKLVNGLIDSAHLDKSNIMRFMEGYYSKHSSEGIIENLDDEIDGKRIKMDNKKNIIAALINCAKDYGLAGDENVQSLQLILEDYTTGDYSDATDFNHSSWWEIAKKGTIGAVSGAGGGAIIGGIAGSWTGPLSAISAAAGALYGGITGAVTGIANRETDNEKIDKLMKKIYNTIKNIQAKK